MNAPALRPTLAPEQAPAGRAQVADLWAWLREAGAGPEHARQVLRRWLWAQPQDGGRRKLDSYYPAALRAALPALLQRLDALASVALAQDAEDASEKLLLQLADAQTVEAVLLPRGGLCVSTQVGCAVGCGFCMTGRSGLLRQLGGAEIVAQVARARQRRAVKKVVFMGMGEPAHNLDAVLDAIDLLGTLGGIGHKELVFSTVGDERAFERLLARGPGQVRPALALSLHTSKPALREQLLPRAPRIAPAELMRQAGDYAAATGYPLQVQWTLLEGVNDGDDELDGITELLRGRHALINLIPYNSVPGLPYRRPAWERAAQMARTLAQRGILCKLRRSAGQDVDAGCGQLRARVVDGDGVAVAVPLRREAVRRLAG